MRRKKNLAFQESKQKTSHTQSGIKKTMMSTRKHVTVHINNIKRG